MQTRKTRLGLTITEFTDRNGHRCYLQESEKPGHVFLGESYASMHLDQPLAAEIVRRLQVFIDTGDLPS